MRSRYSAYVIGKYQYIYDTYAEKQKADLSVAEIENNAKGTDWLRLEVIASSDDQVEFKAYYSADQQFFVMHETSSFVQENNGWKYDTGTIYPDSGAYKPGRNDPCLCGSGKKYKKCCG